MVQPEHEHTLNVWLADLLRKNYGIDARQEQGQAGGGRIDVEIHIGPVKIALEEVTARCPSKSHRLRPDRRQLRQFRCSASIAFTALTPFPSVDSVLH